MAITSFNGIAAANIVNIDGVAAASISNLNGVTFGAAFDPDAQTFITDAGITDSTQQLAINQLVLDLKGLGNYSSDNWTYFQAVYPFVGGSASSHSYNLINTSYAQITWSGGMTHNSNGITGNGTNAFGNTNINCQTQLVKTETFVGSYCGTNTAQNGYDMGATANSNVVGHISRYGGNQVYYRPWNAGANQTTSTDSRGWNAAGRFSTTQIYGIKNATTTTYNVTYSTNAISEFLYILALRTSGGGVTAYSDKNLRFAIVGSTPPSNQHSDLYNSIQDFQTTLGRQV